MSSQILNTYAIESFKERVGYNKIKSTLVDDRLVYIDWSNITFENNKTKWNVDSVSITALVPNHVEINMVLINDDNEIDLDVHVFTNYTNQMVLDESMSILSRTSMPEITMEYVKDGPGDVYFRSNDEKSGYDVSAICVFKNIILEASTSDENVNILPIISNIYNIMNQHLKEKNDIKVIESKYIISNQEVNVGDQVVLDIKQPKGDSFLIKLLPDYRNGLELVNNNDNKFVFFAKNEGGVSIKYSVIDRMTLYSATFDVVLNISR